MKKLASFAAPKAKSLLQKKIAPCATLCSPSILKNNVQKRNRTDATHFRDNHVIFTTEFGMDILHDPLLNKGTGFSKTERDRLGLRGLLPPTPKSMDLQIQRLQQSYNRLTDDIDKYEFMIQLQDRNETLFYKILIENIKRLAPIIYTPTVGRACQEFGSSYRRPRGMYFSAEDKGEMRTMIYNYPIKEVDVIVVTDGGRILGLGDLGANGMGIPIGKLSLYVAAGGFSPGRILPVMLDVGTNNETLLNDPYYLGINRKRITGSEYFELVDEFMEAVTMRYPNVLVQFEDFTPDKAPILLEKYRDKFLCFNDDIQGTGSVVISGMLNAMRAKGKQFKDIANQKIVLAGAGAAGLGVADALVMAMQQEGISEEQALKNFYICDAHGLITINRVNGVLNAEGKEIRTTAYQLRYAMVRDELPEGLSLLETVKRVKPDILLGISGQGGLFTDEIITEMYKCNIERDSRPIIFPLSNPTSKAEATAEQIFRLTKGTAIMASGSPFAPVKLPEISATKTFYATQGNNMFIFPGVGLASVIAGCKHITTEMFYAASKSLASQVTQQDLEESRVYPQVENIRAVTRKIAKAVLEKIIEDKQAFKLKPKDYERLDEIIDKKMWKPEYAQIVSHNE